jgi:hypothetical protein
MPLAQVVQAVQACATSHFEVDEMPKLGGTEISEKWPLEATHRKSHA